MTPVDAQRKADQHWEMAGLARQDGDAKDADKHSAMAREYETMAKGLRNDNRR
jgi:hypothetical protein